MTAGTTYFSSHRRIDILPDESTDIAVPALMPWYLRWVWKEGERVETSTGIDLTGYMIEARVYKNRNVVVVIPVTIDPDQTANPGVFELAVDQAIADEIGVGVFRWALFASSDAFRPVLPKIAGEFEARVL